MVYIHKTKKKKSGRDAFVVVDVSQSSELVWRIICLKILFDDDDDAGTCVFDVVGWLVRERRGREGKGKDGEGRGGG